MKGGGWAEHHRRKCVKKRAYPNQRQAEQAMAAMPPNRDTPRLNTYPCGDHWHIGRRPVTVDRSLYR